MILLFFGMVVGWLSTIILQGIAEAQRYYYFEGDTYKELTGNYDPQCSHWLVNTCNLNGVEVGECKHCLAVFARAQDLRAGRYG